jgi:hypothetical protein
MTRIILAAIPALLLLCAFASVARAAPPPVGSDDWNIMKGYEKWVIEQHDTLGRWCCSTEDARPVEARINDDHWEAHVRPEQFPGEADRWVIIPPEKIIKAGNPVGVALLWLYQGRPQCFSPPDGV